MDSLHRLTQVLVLCATVALGGCATTSRAPVEITRVPLPEADRRLAINFLRALYRTDGSNYRIVLVPDAEETERKTPLRERRAALSTRLALLRTAPSDTVQVRIESVDTPAPTSNLTIGFHRKTGRFEVLASPSISLIPDLSIDVRHWNDGTRLVCLDSYLIGDQKDEIFRLRKGEREYRFTSSSLPNCILIVPIHRWSLW